MLQKFVSRAISDGRQIAAMAGVAALVLTEDARNKIADTCSHAFCYIADKTAEHTGLGKMLYLHVAAQAMAEELSRPIPGMDNPKYLAEKPVHCGCRLSDLYLPVD